MVADKSAVAAINRALLLLPSFLPSDCLSTTIHI